MEWSSAVCEEMLYEHEQFAGEQYALDTSGQVQPQSVPSGRAVTGCRPSCMCVFTATRTPFTLSVVVHEQFAAVQDDLETSVHRDGANDPPVPPGHCINGKLPEI